MNQLRLPLSILVFMLASSLAGAEGSSCRALFFPGLAVLDHDYQMLNPTGRQSAAEYTRPNNRRARDYARVLFASDAAFEAAIKNGDTLLDVGGGQGRAMWNLTNHRDVNAIVINTQDFSDAYPAPKLGRLTYKVGWAEEILPTLRAGSVDEAFDMYGAFTYSTRKDLLIEEIFRVLKPGGHAHLLFDHSIASAVVETSRGVQRLDHWLVKVDPQIFSTRETSDNGRSMSVIVITKPVARFLRPVHSRLSLGLDILDADINPQATTVPRVYLRAR